jgi:hypothetical protein
MWAVGGRRSSRWWQGGVVKVVERLITEAFRPASSESAHNSLNQPLTKESHDA